jgi:hypothetical protein
MNVYLMKQAKGANDILRMLQQVYGREDRDFAWVQFHQTGRKV